MLENIPEKYKHIIACREWNPPLTNFETYWLLVQYLVLEEDRNPVDTPDDLLDELKISVHEQHYMPYEPNRFVNLHDPTDKSCRVKWNKTKRTWEGYHSANL